MNIIDVEKPDTFNFIPGMYPDAKHPVIEIRLERDCPVYSLFEGMKSALSQGVWFY